MPNREWLASLAEAFDRELGVDERQRLLAGVERLTVTGASAAGEQSGAGLSDWFAGFADRLGQHDRRALLEDILQQCCPCGAPEMLACVRSIWAECATLPQFAYELERRRAFGKSIAWRDNAIIVTKVPIGQCGPEYQHDHRGRHSASCHCDMASRLTRDVPATFCACGGGFFRRLFHGVWGCDPRVETLSTVISGGSECLFAIHVPQEHIDAERSIALYWRTLAKARGGVHVSAGGVSWVTSQTGRGPARIYSLQLSDGDAARQLADIRSRIMSGELPDGILFTPVSGPADLQHLLSGAGFRVNLDTPCMMRSLREIDEPALPPTVTVEQVEAGEPLDAWTDIVNTDLYGEAVMDAIHYGDLLTLPNVRFYLARVGGVPAATCMTIADGDLATLEMVATRAALRRKGIARAMVLRALSDLRHDGVHSLHLRAEPDALPFYRTLGFINLGPRILATLR